MKKLFYPAVLILLGALPAFTQSFSLGPTIGLNNAWLEKAPGDTRGQLGLNAGLTMVYSSEEHWGLGLDLKYSAEGVMTKLGSTTAKTHLNYIRVPVKFYYFFNKFGDELRPKIYFGPALGLLAGGKTEQFLDPGTRTFNSKDLYESTDLGLVFGTGFNYHIAKATWLNLDLAYGHGLTNIAKIGKAYNRNVSLNIGVAWGL